MTIKKIYQVFENYLSDAKTEKQIRYLIKLLNSWILFARIYNRQRSRVTILTEIKKRAEEKLNEVN